jgi:hypothetical protein
LGQPSGSRTPCGGRGLRRLRSSRRPLPTCLWKTMSAWR